MQTKNKRATTIILSALAGFALAGGISSSPAAAQDPTPNNNTQTTDQNVMNPWNMTYPTGISYPMAPPGMINNWHWTDWTQAYLAPGSAYDARHDLLWQWEKHLYENGLQVTENPEYPGYYYSTGISYPMSPAGMINDWHYTDWTQTQLAPGSAYDAHRDILWHRAQTMSENGLVVSESPGYYYPTGISYPMSPPGLINAWHYTDWTQTQLAPGSAYDAEYEQMLHQQMQAWQNLHGGEQIGSSDSDK